MELHLNDRVLFQYPVTNDDKSDEEHLILLLRLLVILVHLPEESIWDKLKKKNNPTVDINVKYRQPFSNSYVLFLRHILHFTGLGKHKVRGESNLREGITVIYQTAEKVMIVLAGYLQEKRDYRPVLQSEK